MRAEVLAVGTELLLGQIVDTNGAWIGEQLALAGIDCHHRVIVGDNQARVVDALRQALRRADAVIVCGGLGPTHDDLTRESIAEVMGVELRRDPDLVEVIRELFASRRRPMPASNERQADVPEGAAVIPQTRGTAPGLICPVGEQVIYAVPGVPHEMTDMLQRAVLPDLRRRSGDTAVIRSRTLRTWGDSESGLAERLAGRITALEGAGNPTLAFLASGMEGLKVRITAKAATVEEAEALVAGEEGAVRALLGDLVFGVDDQTMESVVLDLLRDRGATLAVAESVTGGLVAARLTAVAGASDVFRGGVVAYASDVKHDLLAVPAGPVVSEEAAVALAAGVRRLLGADVGLGVTGVAGPARQEGRRVGTVYLGVDLGDEAHAHLVHLPGDRERIRQYATISLLDLLRRRLLARGD